MIDRLLDWPMRPEVRRFRRWSFVPTFPAAAVVARLFEFEGAGGGRAAGDVGRRGGDRLAGEGRPRRGRAVPADAPAGARVHAGRAGRPVRGPAAAADAATEPGHGLPPRRLWGRDRVRVHTRRGGRRRRLPSDRGRWPARVGDQRAARLLADLALGLCARRRAFPIASGPERRSSATARGTACAYRRTPSRRRTRIASAWCATDCCRATAPCCSPAAAASTC